MSTKRRCFDASSFHCGQGAGRYSDALKKIAAATRTINGTMSADEDFFWRGAEMEEKERREMDALCEKKDRTVKEDKRYQELLRRFFDETLYYGGNEEE